MDIVLLSDVGMEHSDFVFFGEALDDPYRNCLRLQGLDRDMGLSRMSWHKEIVLGTGQHIGVPKLFGIIHLNLEV